MQETLPEEDKEILKLKRGIPNARDIEQMKRAKGNQDHDNFRERVRIDA